MIKHYEGGGVYSITLTSTNKTLELNEQELAELLDVSETLERESIKLKEEVRALRGENKFVRQELKKIISRLE